MESSIRFLSLNVGMKSNLAGLSSILVNKNLDLAMLQEVRITDEQLSSQLEKYGYTGKVNINVEDSSKPGTALVWRSSLPVRDVAVCVPCRAQVAYLGAYAIMNVYAPSGSDKKYERGNFFSREIFRILSLHSESKWLLGGDFNCVLKPIDIENGTGFQQKKCLQLAELVKTKKLWDAFRYLYPISKEFTFFRATAAPSRLDRFYLPRDLLLRVVEVEHVASLSDHCGVLMEIKLQDVSNIHVRKEGKKTYWKLNVAILQDDEFLDNFADLWNWLRTFKSRYSDIADWWDQEAKPGIKEFCILFSKRRNNRRRDSKKFWFAYLKSALLTRNWSEVARIKEKVNNILLEDASGYVIRSRFKNSASNEVASLYHANKELKNSKKNSLNKLKINGVVVDDANVIETEVKQFFNSLFNGYHDTTLVDTGASFVPNFSGLDSYLDGLGSLPDVARDELEKDMLIEELSDIVKTSENNRSPGLDGLSYEIYKTTFDLIQDELLEVFQCQLNRKKIVDSNTEGVTRLAPKVDGIPSVDELRPITLLNCDYKLLSKWFVRRVKPVLHLIIKSGQLCTVGKKNILFGVSNILSSIMSVKQNELQACLISLDFFKAYDRVLLDFLVKVMKKMNFGDTFVSWILMLHKGARTRFILGFLTSAIEVTFSIRQGDPLAMILYIIYVEPLLHALERSLVGLRLSFVRQTLEAYCDDINLLTDDLGDFVKMSEEVSKFESYSGAILSRDKKSKVVGFGKWAGRENWPVAWLKPVKSIKIFGVFVCDSYSELLTLNWDFRFKKFSNAIFSWSSRILDTLQQRVEVIRVFALSRVYYISSILPIRSNMVKKFESIMGKFIWKGSGKVLRVALDELKNEHLAGGLGLTCLTTMSDALLSSQCIRLLRSGDEKSLKHVDFWLGSLLADVVPGMGQGVQAVEGHGYFDHLGDCLTRLMISEQLCASTICTLTNKMIYSDIASFPPPKIVRESDLDYGLVWKRLFSNVVDAGARDILFLLIHNKLPVPERLFRIGLKQDPYCRSCVGAEFGDLEHFFCSCEKTRNAWAWVRLKILDLCDQALNVSNWELLNLFLPGTSYEQEIIWLVGNFVCYVWENIFIRNTEVKLEKLFGFLSFKYKMDMKLSGVSLVHIRGLSY